MLPAPDPIIFTLGPFAMRWYGLLIMLGAVLGAYVAHRRAAARGLDPSHITNLLLLVVPVGLVVSRAYYVAFNWDLYQGNLGEMVAVWHGGLTIHGAVIGGIGVALIYLWVNRMNLLQWLDVGIVGLPLGQAIGRWGNYFNQEAFGIPTDLPWGIPIKPENRPPEYAQYGYFHPTFLYESIWDFGVFLTLLVVSNGRRVWLRPGDTLWLYGLLYSAGRFFAEGLRTDSLMLGEFRVAQLVSATVVVACALLLYLRHRGPLAGQQTAPPEGGAEA